VELDELLERVSAARSCSIGTDPSFQIFNECKEGMRLRDEKA